MKLAKLLCLSMLLWLLAPALSMAQASSFTYQGQLRDAGQPFTGMADLEFRLYDQLSAGSQIGSAQSLNAVPVEDGLFQVELDFGASVFDGSDRFLEITVDGSPLTPRQKVTATPYALLASGLATGSVGAGSVDPTEVQLRVVGTCPAGEYVQEVNQDGSVICGIDALGNGDITSITAGTGLLGGGTSGDVSLEVDANAFWSNQGNAATANDVLGTSNDQPLRLVANGRTIMELDDAFIGSVQAPNIKAGAASNTVSNTHGGAVISGGGGDPLQTNCGPLNDEPCINRTDGDYAVIGGGFGNFAGGFSVVSGGAGNLADLQSTVGGGTENRALGGWSAVGGGFSNQATEPFTSIGGGNSNRAIASGAVVGGGLNNEASGERSTVGGGASNLASALQSTVAGGDSNWANGLQSTVGGGIGNRADVEGTSIGGGGGNRAFGIYSTVAGGFDNETRGIATTVSGGESHRVNGDWATVGGGFTNLADGEGGTVPGGQENSARGRMSFAAGERAIAFHDGAFVWASGGTGFASEADNQFLVQSDGGVGFGRTPDDYFEIQTPFSEINGDGAGEQGAFRVRLNGTTRLRLLRNGGLAIGNSYTASGVPDNGLRVAGRVRIGSLGTAGTTQLCQNSGGEISSCSSSGRYKTGIRQLDLGLDAVLAMQPVAYRWITDDSADIGFVAEEIAAIDERLITRSASGDVEGVRYDRFSAVLAHALQEMNGRLMGLDEENRRLRARLDQIEFQQASALRSIQTELTRLQARSTDSKGPAELVDLRPSTHSGGVQ
jgi:hypothetical protein